MDEEFFDDVSHSFRGYGCLRKTCFHVGTSKLFPFFCLVRFFCRPLRDAVFPLYKGCIV